VRSDINANETATFLIAAWEGYVVLGKNSQDPRTMQSGQRRVSGHIVSLLPARGWRRVAGRAAPPKTINQDHHRFNKFTAGPISKSRCTQERIDSMSLPLAIWELLR
jgi:hypothetical protein